MSHSRFFSRSHVCHSSLPLGCGFLCRSLSCATRCSLRRRCARRPTPPLAPPPLCILGFHPTSSPSITDTTRFSPLLPDLYQFSPPPTSESRISRCPPCRFAPYRGDAGRRFRHLLGRSRLYRLRQRQSPSRLPNP